jgi:hypothetical protein
VDEATLQSFVRRLVISLEAKIINSNAPDRDGPPASEIIHTGTVEEKQAPFIVSSSSGSDSPDGFMLAIWKLPVFLIRPRIRLHGPSAIFSASANLKPLKLSYAEQSQNGYLASGVPLGLNLLAPFDRDPALGGVEPYLPARRVSRVAPLTSQAKDHLQPIKTYPRQLSLRIYPAVHARIRFARPNTTPPSPEIIAMLEVDFTPFFECEISLTSITMSVVDGIVEDLATQPGMSLPMSCVAHDHITFLYRISPEEIDPALLARNPIRALNINVAMTALEQPGICTPQLKMAWTTTVDFTLPVNPNFGSAMQSIQRSHRPNQLSINNITSLTAPAVSRPDSLPTLEGSGKTETPLPELGITVTLTPSPPSQKIYPGDEFAWSVFVVNRARATPSAQARKLALIAIPKRRRNEIRVTRPPSTSHPPAPSASILAVGATTTTAGPGAGAQRSKTPRDSRDGSVADAVLDDSVVHAMQHNSLVDSAELVSLSADVRVGPLAPGSCHVAELRFLALRVGVIGLDAIRVVDLATSEHVDIRDLPVVVVERPEDRETTAAAAAPAAAAGLAVGGGVAQSVVAVA